MAADGWLLSVGMEVHAELHTRSKMFCADEVTFGKEPNTRVSELSLGLPGSLPVPNKEAIAMVLRTALALDCDIPALSVFHRKHYFYPDLPKGFQISQYEDTNPLGYKGKLDIPTPEGGTKPIHIMRTHLEEDTGKLMHLPGGQSGIDYNRAGTPLMEVVTDFPPDIQSPDEAKEYLVRLRQILLYLGVCDGKMEQGSLRCEPNISVRPENSDDYGTKTELKNLNSFASVQSGVAFERVRQIEAYKKGEGVRQETRGWDEVKQESFVMRVKESAMDYRYFPDPDLAPMEISQDWIDELKATIPELPLAKERRYRDDLGLTPDTAELMARELPWADYFEEGVNAGGDAKEVAKWMQGELSFHLSETGQTVESNHAERATTKVTPNHIVELTKLQAAGTISGTMAKEIFAEMFKSGDMPSEVVKARGMSQISDEGPIEEAADDAIEGNPGPLQQYLEGKESVQGFFVGQVMRAMKGQANPQVVQRVVKERLEKRR